MSLDLGTLYGAIAWNTTQSDQALAGIPHAAQQAIAQTEHHLAALPAAAHQQAAEAATLIERELDEVPAAARDAGEESGDSFGKGLATKGVAAAATAAAAVGATFASGVMQAIAREPVEDRLAAALGGSEQRMARYGETAGKIYANNFGENLQDVAASVEAVATTVEGIGPGGRLQRLTEDAINFAEIIGIEVPRSVQIAQQLVTNELAPNIGAAFDLLLASTRRVPLAVREDLTDAADEYGQFFHSMGFSGEAMFSAFVLGSEQGMYGIDKTGDAVKEFSIRATDASASTKDAFKTMGLDYEIFAKSLLRGGDYAGEAVDGVVRGLLKIKDPVKQANAAIALFGTPLEDLGVTKIPSFLKSLRDGDETLGKWEGGLKRAGETLNDNAARDFGAWKRSVQTDFVDFIEAKVMPSVDDWADRMSTDLGPKLSQLWDDMAPGRKVLGDVFEWAANDLFPTVVDGATQIGGAVADFFDDMGVIVEQNPWLQEALDGLVKGGAWLAEHIFPAIGDVAENVLPIIADNIAAAVETVEELVIGFTYVAEAAANSAAWMLDAFGWAFENILSWADATFGWMFELLGMENPIDDALVGFERFREEATDKLADIADGAVLLREEMGKEMEVEVNTDRAEVKLTRLLTAAQGLERALTRGEDPLNNPGTPSLADLLSGDAAADAGGLGGGGGGRGGRGGKGDGGGKGDKREGAVHVEHMHVNDFQELQRQADTARYMSLDGIDRGAA